MYAYQDVLLFLHVPVHESQVIFVILGILVERKRKLPVGRRDACTGKALNGGDLHL
jgi:hypothetical protein